MKCEGGETGRRTGLKILRWQHRAGSIPALRTIFKYPDLLFAEPVTTVSCLMRF